MMEKPHRPNNDGDTAAHIKETGQTESINPFGIKNGKVPISGLEGLGIEIDLNKVKENDTTEDKGDNPPNGV